MPVVGVLEGTVSLAWALNLVITIALKNLMALFLERTIDYMERVAQSV